MPVPGLEEVNLFQTPFPFGGAFLKALLLCSEVTQGQENELGLARWPDPGCRTAVALVGRAGGPGAGVRLESGRGDACTPRSHRGQHTIHTIALAASCPQLISVLLTS